MGLNGASPLGDEWGRDEWDEWGQPTLGDELTPCVVLPAKCEMLACLHVEELSRFCSRGRSVAMLRVWKKRPLKEPYHRRQQGRLFAIRSGSEAIRYHIGSNYGRGRTFLQPKTAWQRDVP